MDASGGQFNGVCVQSVASGNTVAVATRGAMVLVANNVVTAVLSSRVSSCSRLIYETA